MRSPDSLRKRNQHSLVINLFSELILNNNHKTTFYLLNVFIGMIINREDLTDVVLDGMPKSQGIVPIVKAGQFLWIVYSSIL